MDKRPIIVSCIHFLLLSTVFLIPLFSLNYLPYVTIEKTLLFYCLIDITVCLWLYTILQNKAYLPPRNVLLTVAGIFLAVYFIAGLRAESPEIALWSTMTRMSGLILLFHIAAFVLMLISTLRDKKAWRRIMAVVAVSGVLAAIPTHFATLFPEHKTALINSTFGNSSYVAAFLTFSLFFSLLLFFESKKRGSKIFFATCAGVIVFSPLFLTLQGLLEIFADPAGVFGTARAASVSVVVGLVFAGLVYAASSKRKLLARSAQFVAIVLAALLVVVSVLVFVPGSFVQSKLTDFNIGSRTLFWESALEGIEDRPLLGFGPEHYFVPFYKYFEPALMTEEYAYEVYTSKPHSAYLEVLVSGGLLSFVPYMGIWITAFILLFKAKMRGILSRSETALLVGLISAYLLQNIVFFDTLSSYLGIGIVLAYLVHVSSVRDRLSLYPSIPRAVSWYKAAVAFGISAIAVYVFAWMPIVQQVMLVRVIGQVTVVERSRMYEELFALSPHVRTSMAEYLVSKELEMVPAVIMDATPQERELILNDIRALRKTVNAYAGKDPVYYRLTLYITRLHLLELVLESDPHKRDLLLKAVRVHEQILEKLSPGNPQSYWAKAQRQLFEGSGEDALASLRESDASAPGIPETWEKISKVEKYLSEGGSIPFFTR